MSVTITIEKSSDEQVWGRVEYRGDLLVDSAKTIEALERKFKKLLHDFHDVDPDKIKFDLAFDLTSFFETNQSLNISAVAEIAGINPSLMRQYASGSKIPSAEQAKKIEEAIRSIGKNLANIKIGSPAKKAKERQKATA